ncbi:uncharacterized protein LOC127794068 [Diospyros lotus]|uniref:uncharacterized protein LOC127794068 n=1 Tax=Diospyros lotus TaxID=55363 RepID=UPI0022558BBC|nr:uncharacterized protein LOC127794068 [Diospyros lotus]
MTSHFRGYGNLMKIMFIIFFLLLGNPAVAGRENPSVELFTRDELVKMAGYGEEKLSTVLISGSVLCRPTSCSDDRPPTNPQAVSGALVAISCHTSGKTSKSNWVESTTDEFGDFLIDLPSHLHAIPSLDKRCLVKLLRLPKNSSCSPPAAFTGTHAGLKLSSVGNGVRTYTAESLYLTKPSRRCANAENTEGKGALLETFLN